MFFPFLWILMWVALAIYLLKLISRFIRAFEKMADKYEANEKAFGVILLDFSVIV